MEKLDYQPKAHLFICCRERKKGKGCCASKGGEELVSELKSWVKKEGLHKDIKVSRSSCLGYCESGIAATLYPKNQWIHEISMEDLPEIKKMLLKYAK